MPAPVWEGIVSLLTPSQTSPYGSVHPHLAGDVHLSVRASALKKKDFVPPLVPLVPCWSIVIAASEAGVSTKTGIRDGSVSMDQRWLQWVNKLLPALKAGNPEIENLEFRLSCSSKHIHRQPTLWDSAA